MINEAALAAMKRSAFLVNVARGDIVDGEALVAALAAGRLAGAALDVAEVEPIPADSPVWETPNLIISPHIAGGGSTGYPQQKALFGKNLALFSAGRPLVNVCRPGPVEMIGGRFGWNGPGSRPGHGAPRIYFRRLSTVQLNG